MTTNNVTETKEIEQNPEAKNWAMFCHLSALVGFIIPFGNIIGPLIIWQMKKNEFPFVDDQGKQALNFQISMTIYIFVSILLIIIAVGILLLIILGVVSLILTVIAAINASNGTSYRYPLTIEFVK